MKLTSALLALSLAGNAAIAVVFVGRPSALSEKTGGEANLPAAATAPARSTPGVKRAAARAETRADTWASLETDDLPALVQRLRAAGFPPAAIRAIISAKIEARFRGRMQALAKSVDDTPYWHPAPLNALNNPQFMEERQQVYRERARLMRELLGSTETTAAGDLTDYQRRQYGDMPKAKIDLIEQINADYNELTAQVRAASQGIMLPEDAEKIAYLQREKRADLAAVLSPQELEDYEMRTSTTTMRLRSAMTYMDATEQEFRAIYAIQKRYDDILNPSQRGGAMTSELMEQRREAQAKMEAETLAALGPERGADFARASSNEYRQLAQLAQRDNRPLSAATEAFDVRSAAAAESQRIGNDAALSYEQKREALRVLAQNTRIKLNGALGPAGDAYAQSASWLKAIENGSIVSFTTTGSSFRSLPRPRP